MLSSRMNLITTVIGFGLCVAFIGFVCTRIICTSILFVCTRIICSRLRASESRQMLDTQFRIDIEQPEQHVNGLEPVMVAAIPTIKFSSEAFSAVEDAMCSICLGEYKEKEVLRIMPKCGHNFHAACIDIWLSKQSTCPVCRLSIQDCMRQAPTRMFEPTDSPQNSTEHFRTWPPTLPPVSEPPVNQHNLSAISAYSEHG